VITAAALPLEILFTIEDDDGQILSLETIEGFECRDRSCAPPPIGTGGSKEGAAGAHEGTVETGLPTGPGTPDSTMDALFPNRRDVGPGSGKVQHKSGVMSVEGLNADGSFVKYDDRTEAAAAARWDELGISRQKATENLVHTAEIAMGLNPATGKFDPGAVQQARQIGAWYSTQGKRLEDLASKEGVDHDAVVAAATVLSAGRLWDGVKNGNYETTENLIRILKDDKPIQLGDEHVAFMEWRAAKAEGGKVTSQIGLDYRKTGSVKPSDLDSAQLVEVMYAVQSMRGYKSFDEWAAASNNGLKSPKAHLTEDPIYPLFTSKGTNQVQQAVAVLRGEVTARGAISGPKYSSFFSNLRRPDLDYSSTNDTWHYRAMAGNTVLNPMVKKNRAGPGTIRELTVKESAKYDVVLTAQDQFQTGLAVKKYNLGSGDLMFRDSTKITRDALDTLKERHPEQFGDMKLHEIQALVWVYYGGGQAKGSVRESNWDRALRTLPDWEEPEVVGTP
jgi:hypothetical protein